MNKTGGKRPFNRAPGNILRQGMEGKGNEEVLIKMPERNSFKHMINLEQNKTRPAVPRIFQEIVINHPSAMSNSKYP